MKLRVPENDVEQNLVTPASPGTRRQGSMSDGSGSHPLVHRLKAITALLRSRPHVGLIPLLTFMVFVALGVYGVKQALLNDASAQSDRTRATAQSFAKSVKFGLSLVQGPLKQLNGAAHLSKNWLDVASVIDSSLSLVWQVAPLGSISMAIAPAGRIYQPYPPSNANKILVGVDMLAPGTTQRDTSLRTLAFDPFSDAGPQPVFLPFGVTTFTIPIWWQGVDANETFNMPWQLTPAPGTYINQTRTKLWGFAALSVKISQFQALTDGLAQLPAGYQAQITRAGIPPAETGIVPMLSDVLPPENAAAVQVMVGDVPLFVHVWDSYQAPKWLMYMYIVVVLGSLIFSALMFAMLMSWEENHALLHHLLPKQMIQRIRAEVDWSTLNNKEETLAVSMETPAQNMLTIIQANMLDQVARPQLLLAVRDALQRSADVYKPTLEQLKDRMKDSEFVDAEVRQALVTQLVGTENRGNSMTEEEAPGCEDGECDDGEEEEGAEEGRVNERTSAPGPEGKPMGLIPALLTSGKLKMPPGDSGSSKGSGGGGRGPFASYKRRGLIPPGRDLEAEGIDAHDVMLVLMRTPVGANESLADFQACIRTARREGSITVAPHPSFSDPQSPRDMGTILNPLFQRSHQRPSGQSSVAEDGERITSGVERVSSALSRAPAMSRRDIQVQMIAAPRDVFTQLDVILAGATEWVFDAHALDVASQGRPLSVLAFWLLHSTGLKAWAHMDTAKLVRFLQQVEDNYPNNPYHNRKHAANVLQSMHVILHRGGLMPGYVDQLTLLACYMSAIVHDVGHRGRNNDFLVNAHDELAILYNDKSPMENHHVATAFRLLCQPSLNCLSGLSKANWLKLRKLVIDLVLATDMKAHFATLGQFDALPRIGPEAGTPLRTSLSLKDRYSPSNSSRKTNEVDVAVFIEPTVPAVPVNDTDRLLSLQVALKCADVGHLTSPLDSHLKWVAGLEEEFFLQGDAERANGLPISPLCDRTKEGVSKSQVGFFNFVVNPMFKSFCGRFRPCKPLWLNLMTTYHYWKRIAANSEKPSMAGSAVTEASAAPSKNHTAHNQDTQLKH